ncbi:MAG: FAD-dependent oxidoreductase, partial [Acidimicrobiia bacterium]|nr:FAD-dependent oxidoreductase [Acidimicrobiia bacterium]
EFAKAAVRAKTAGYDGIELHAAHGYLLAQFMSPGTNDRTDRYGGTLENRMAFLLQVVAACRQAVGPAFPITVRVSGEEHTEGGQNITDTVLGAVMLEAAGVDAIHVSAGGIWDPEWIIDPMPHPEGCKVDLARAVKDAVSIPVITVGVLRHPEYAEEVLARGEADFVALGRALLADPFWPEKAAKGCGEDITRCFSCNWCSTRSSAGLAIRCTVNPEAGDPGWVTRLARKPDRTKRVLVVGGGAAGLEAARVAALRGHEVHLHEALSELGGQLSFASKVLGKDKIGWMLDDLIRDVAATTAQVATDSTVTPELVAELSPDVVILACGGRPAKPPIPGIDGDRVISAWDFLRNPSEVSGQSFVVVGGSSTGCEVAVDVADRGATVAIVEMRDALAMEMEPIARREVRDEIADSPDIDVYLSHRVTAIDGGEVTTIGPDGVERVVKGDRVILAIGTASERGLAVELAQSGIQEVYQIGDASRPATIHQALTDARGVAASI